MELPTTKSLKTLARLQKRESPLPKSSRFREIFAIPEREESAPVSVDSELYVSK
jgi:hypothetical protein